MDTYYIYMIEIECEKSKEKKYYVGKSHQLETRLHNHISRNRKTFKSIKEEYKVTAIKEIHKIQGLTCSLNNKKVDSITSRLENRFVTEKSENNGKKYFGGNIAKSLTCKRYCDELKEYDWKEVINIEYEVTEDNKDEIAKKVMSDINNFSTIISDDETL